MPKPKLSYSALNMLARCGQQFYFRYIEHLKVPPGIASLVGRGVDGSANSNLGNKIQTGELLPLEQIRDIARDTVHAEWHREGVWLTKEEAQLGMKRCQAMAVDESVTLATLHARQAAPKIQPTHVQRKWDLEIRGVDIDLTGYIDIQEGRQSVRDTKTSAKSPTADEADKSMQLTTYAMAVAAIDGAPPERVALDYLVKTKTPKLVQIESKRTKADFDHVLQRVYQASKAMESGIFTPAPLDAWWCSDRWCGYAHKCPYFRRPVSVAVPQVSPAVEPETEGVPA